jgi:hypothetical protein
MRSPTLIELSRWQFAVTVAFHMTFPRDHGGACRLRG